MSLNDIFKRQSLQERQYRQERREAEYLNVTNITENIIALARECLNERPKDFPRETLLVLSDALEEAGNPKAASVCRPRSKKKHLRMTLLMVIHKQGLRIEIERRKNLEIGGCSCGAKFYSQEEMDEHEYLCPFNTGFNTGEGHP